MHADLAPLAGRLRRSLGDDAIVTDEAQLRTYECDGLTHYRAVPGLVALPRSAEQVRAVVRECAEAGVPFVARGTGTGLSGGALPIATGVLIVTSRMRRIIDVDLANQRAVVEPGVVNLTISDAVRRDGYFYAPDPSSRIVCTIGGNVAENSGGAHCLKYGFTTHHVTGIEVCTPDGALVWIGGGKAVEVPGYDLVGVFVGAEGTLGVATKIAVKLLRAPEAVVTVLAAFRTVDEAGSAVSAIIASGLTPAAAEIMDAPAVEAAERAVHAGYPTGAGAVLIVECDGPAAEVADQVGAVAAACERAGAFALRRADDAVERAAMWRGRKSAFAAVGRISPDYIVQDAVIPRTRLAEVLHDISRLAADAGVRVANVFHAGDGNLHPLVLFDGRRAGAAAAAEEVSGAILDLCVAHGGSITGEERVGVDEASKLRSTFSPADLDTVQLVRRSFDPRQLSNPGKVFPTPRLCGERPRVHTAGGRPTGPEGVDLW